MRYNVYITKASDGINVAYSYLLQQTTDGSYEQDVILMKAGKESDHSAFQRIIRIAARKKNIMQLDVIMDGSLLDLTFELLDVEQAENEALCNVSKRIMKRFLKCDIQGGDGSEYQETAVLDEAIDELERNNTAWKRLKTKWSGSYNG